MDRSHRPVQRRRVQERPARNYLLSKSTALCVNTHIRALKAAEGLTRGDFTKSAACTVAFAVIGVAGPNVVGKNKNTPYCGPRNRRDRTMLNQPGARARCGGGRRQGDAVGPAGGKHATQSGFGFAGPRP